MLTLYLQAGLSPSSLRRALARKWMKERARQEHSQGADLSLEVLMVLYLVGGAELLIKYPHCSLPIQVASNPYINQPLDFEHLPLLLPPNPVSSDIHEPVIFKSKIGKGPTLKKN